MLKCLLSTLFGMAFILSEAQTGEAIISELHAINKTVASKACNSGNTAAISNRAMNVFLADKTGYLSQSSDLSFYTNYVTLNTGEGKLTVNHNFQKAGGTDEPVRKLFSAGIRVSTANEIAAPFLDKKWENELGLMISYKWLGKVKTHFSDCSKLVKSINQKQSMDALRAALLSSLKSEILKKEAAFTSALAIVDSTEIPDQDIDSAKAIMLLHFYEDLKEEYVEKFAKGQAETLTITRSFKLITTSWTSLSAYIPVVSPSYTVATSISSSFRKKPAYPFAIMLSHTRLWESKKTGRWFLTAGGTALYTNSKQSYELQRMNLSQYQRLGGTDTFHITDLKNDKAYIGNYQNFITPSIQARLVYFPPADSHVGVSVALEQNFGRHHLLNSKIGIPVVLINSKRWPAANLEFYVQFFDLNHTIELAKRNGSRTAVGLNIGIPFSRLMY